MKKDRAKPRKARRRTARFAGDEGETADFWYLPL